MATKIKGFNIETDAIDKIEDRIQTRISTPGNTKVRPAITNLVDSSYVQSREDATQGGLLNQNALVVPSFDSAGAAALTGADGMLIFNTTQQKLTYFDSDNEFKPIIVNSPPVFTTPSGSLGTIYDRSRGVDTLATLHS